MMGLSSERAVKGWFEEALFFFNDIETFRFYTNSRSEPYDNDD